MKTIRGAVAIVDAAALALALVIALPEPSAEADAPPAGRTTAFTFSPTAVMAALDVAADLVAADPMEEGGSVPSAPDTGSVQRVAAAPAAAALAVPGVALPTPTEVIGGLLQTLLSNPFIGPILGPILLFGPIIALVVLACPPCALINFVTGIIRSFLIDLVPVSAAVAVTAAEQEPLDGGLIDAPLTDHELNPASAHREETLSTATNFGTIAEDQQVGVDGAGENEELDPPTGEDDVALVPKTATEESDPSEKIDDPGVAEPEDGSFEDELDEDDTELGDEEGGLARDDLGVSDPSTPGHDAPDTTPTDSQ